MTITLRAAFGLLIGCSALAAQPAVQGTGDAGARVEEIVVVAHKAERPVREIAANVSVLSGTDIRDELATSIADVLSTVPGVEYEGGGSRFGTEGVNIRGIGGNRVALLMDGVPLSDQFEVGSFSNATRDFINAGFLERVEILHGPASALYGSSAIGGVVALRSPEPTELARESGHGSRLSTNYAGADSSLHATALQSLTRGDFGALLGLTVQEGSSPDSAAVSQQLDDREYRRNSMLLKLVNQNDSSGSWRLGYYGQQSEVDSNLKSMLGAGRFRSTTALEGHDTARMDMLLAEYRSGQVTERFGAATLRAYLNRADVEQRTFDERGLAARPVTIDRLFGFNQTIRGLELNSQKDWAGRFVSHRAIIGVEFRSTRTEEYRDGLETGIADDGVTNVLLGEVFPLRDFPVSDTGEWGAYAEDTLDFANWTAVIGLRNDHYRLRPANDSMYAEDYPFAAPVSISVGEVSPKLGLIYRPAPALDVYLQYAHGFRAPPYEDANIGLEMPVFNYRAVPNPDLRSERSEGIDLGLRWNGLHSRFRLSAFRTRYDDFIESKVRLGPDAESGRILFQSQNLDRAVIAGLELGISFDFALDRGTWAIDATAYRARGENKATGQPLNSVGPAQAVIGTSWLPSAPGWRLRMQTIVTDKWSDRDETHGQLFAPAGHAVVDVYASRVIGRAAELRVGFRNLTNNTYWRWADVGGIGIDEPVIPFMAQPGRRLDVGLEFTW